MKKISGVFFAFLGILLLTGWVTTDYPKVSREAARMEASSQYQMAFGTTLNRVVRVKRVGNKILRANLPLCEGTKNGTRYIIGILTAINVQFHHDLRKYVRDQHNIGDYLTVLHVLEDSPASAAGILPGDRLVTINGKPIRRTPVTKPFEVPYVKQKFASMINRFSRKVRIIELTVERGGMEHTLSIVPQLVCNANIIVVSSDDHISAAVDRYNNVYITMGMIRFLENDTELALVIGHELAHATHAHLKKQAASAFVGLLAGAALYGATGVDVTNMVTQMAAQIFSHEYELEADYAGVYYAARAGYNVDKAADFWRRMAVEHPTSIDFRGLSHPSTAVRSLTIEEAVEEIKEKVALGSPVIPNLVEEPDPKDKWR